MPGEIVVGAVAVEVFPQASGFLAKLINQIAPGAAKAGDQVGKDMGERAAKGLTDGVEKGIEDGGKNTRATGKKHAADYADAWARQARTAIASAISDINQNKKFEIPVELELHALAGQVAQLAAIQETLEKLFGHAYKIDLDTGKFDKKLATARAELAKFAAGTTSRRLSLDADKSIADIDKYAKGMRDANTATGKWAADFHSGLEKYLANAADHTRDLDLNAGEAGQALDRVNQQVKELAGARIGKDILDKQAVTDVQDLVAQVKGIDTTTATVRVKAQVAEAEKDLTEILVSAGVIDKIVAKPKVEPQITPPKFDVSSLSGVQQVIKGALEKATSNAGTLKIGADTTEAAREVATLGARVQGLNAKIKFGVEDNEAIAKMIELRAYADHIAKTYKIDFQVDRGAALSFKAISDGLKPALDAIGGIGSQAGDAADSLTKITGSFKGMTPAALAANGAIVGFLVALPALIAVVVGALFGLLGAITAIGGVATVAFGIFGVAVLAIYKVIQAIQERSQVAKAAAATAAQADATELSNKIALRNATQAIANAEKSLAKAKTSEARNTAELAAAEKKQRQARVELRDATKLARIELRELTLAIKDNQVAQQAAIVSITQAREGYNALLADPTASESDLEAAQANYNSKQEDLQKLKIEQDKNALAREKYDRDGLAGSAQYKAAQDSVASATAAVVTQQQQLADAILATKDAQDQVNAAKQSKVDTVGQQAAAQKVTDASAGQQTTVFDSLMPAAKEFVDFYEANIKPLLDDIIKTAQQSGIFDGLESFFASMSTLAPTIKPLVKTLGDLAGVFLEELGKFLAGPEGQQLIKAFEQILPVAFDALSKITFAGFKVISDLLVALAPVVIQLAPQIATLATNFADMFAQVVQSPEFAEFMKYLVANAPDLFKMLVGLMGILFKTMLYLAPIATTVFHAITQVIEFLAKLSPGEVGSIVVAVVGAILAIIVAGIALFLAPIIGVPAAIALAIAAVVIILGIEIVSAFKYLQTHWEKIWGGITKFFSDAVHVIVKAVGDFFSNIADHFTAGQTIVTNHWNNFIDGIHDAFFDRVHAIERGIGNFWSGIQTAFRNGVDNARRIFEELIDGISHVINLDIGVVNRYLIGGFNRVSGWVHGPTIPDIPEIPSIQDHTKKAARGAVLPGYAPGKDTEPYLLSKGEAVLVPQLTRQLGADWILTANAKALRGEKIPGFARGGVVDLTPQIIKFERESHVPFTVRSAYRDRIGDNDYHGRGMAVDAVDNAANMVKLASWLYARSPYLLELIHSGGSGYFVKNGKKTGANTYRSVYDAHFSHVHTAMNQAGLSAVENGANPVADGTPDEPTGLAAKALKLVRDKVGDGIKALLGGVQDTTFGKMLVSVAEDLLPNIGTFLIDKVKALASEVADVGGNVLHWLGIGDGDKSNSKNHKTGDKASPQTAAAYAKGQLSKYGWGAGEMSSLASLWKGESSWRWNAVGDPVHVKGLTGLYRAYGIPQSLPGYKMESAGSDWKTNAFTQIDWGLDYIKGRYGDPAAAFEKWQSRKPHHWYDQGGYLPPGLTMAYNGTGKTEYVFTDEQLRAMQSDRNGGQVGVVVRVEDGAVPGLIHAEVDRKFGQLADASIYGGI